MVTKYELPEAVNERLLTTLGKEVEMKTFKTDERGAEELVKLICVGDCSGGLHTKGIFIKAAKYYQTPIGESFDFKTSEWMQRSKEHNAITIRLQIWEIAEGERFSRLSRVCFKHSHGALVFWSSNNPSSLDGVQKWMRYIKEICPSIPCVLITDNVWLKPRQWIGPGKIFESESALDQFCKDHGFVGHFEIKSADSVSGEKSMFGQAINCLLDEVLQGNEKEDKTRQFRRWESHLD